MYTGVKIQATCNQSLMQKLQKQCVVGSWKVINNFSLNQACGFNRHTNHVYRMNFVPQTLIGDCEVSCDNMFHELIDFAKNTNGSCDPRFLIGIYVSFNGYFFIYISGPWYNCYVLYNRWDWRNLRLWWCNTLENHKKRGGKIGDYSKRYQVSIILK